MFEILKKNKAIAVFVAFLVIGLAVFGNSFNNQFFWDDDDVIVNNVYVQEFNVGKFFTESMISGAGQTTSYYRPILLFSFALDYFFWGLNHFGFGLTSALIHILNAWLIFVLLSWLLSLRADPPRPPGADTTPKRGIIFLAFLPALLFLIHPLNTEVVIYICGRADSLAGLFMLLGLLFYCRINLAENQRRKILNYSAAALFFILALLSKETAIAFPFLAVLIAVVFLSKQSGYQRWIQAFKNAWLLFALLAVYLVLHFTVFNFSGINGPLNGCLGEYCSFGIFKRALTFLLVFLNYAGILFLPLGQHMERSASEFGSIYSWKMVAAVFLFLAWATAAIFFWKKEKNIAFGFFWFFILLFPVSGIAVKMLYPTYEHFLYLPMIGFYLVFFCLISALSARIKSRRASVWLKRAFYVIIIGYLVFLVLLTINRNRDWRDPITFYEKNLQYSPGSFIEHNNLGMAYAAAGRIEETIMEYRKAIAIKDVYPQVHYNLANALVQIKKYPEAAKEYEKALAISPDFELARRNLYQLYLFLGEKDKAEEVLKK